MKRTIRPLTFESIHPGALEGYLEHMAQQGWRLRRIVCGFAVFDAAAPAPTRYRVENVLGGPDALDDLTEEQKEFYAAGGWTHLHWLGPGQHLFRADDPAAPAFHTDADIEADTYRALIAREKRGIWLSAAILAGWFVVIAAFLAHDWNTYGLWGLWVRANAHGGTLVWLIAFVLCVLQLVLQGRRLARLRRLVETGRLAQERTRWRSLRRRKRAVPVTGWLIVLMLLAGAWTLDRAGAAPIERAGLPTVTLSDITGQPTDTDAWMYLPGGLFRRYYSQKQTIERGDGQLDILLSAQYYELYDWMPARTVTEAIAAEGIGLDPVSDRRDDPRFDQFYCVSLPDDYLSLTARRGNRVLRLVCIGGDRDRALNLTADALNA